MFGYRQIQYKFIDSGDITGAPFDLASTMLTQYPFDLQTDEDIFYGESRLETDFSAGSVEMSFMAGGSYEWTSGYGAGNLIYTDADTFGWPLDYLNPLHPSKADWEFWRFGGNDYNVGVTGVFGQFSIEPTSRLILTAGGRYDRLDLENTLTFRTGMPVVADTFDAFSPKLSATVKLLPDETSAAVNLYAQYSQAFLPPRRPSGLRPGDDEVNLNPEDIDNYEVGVKSSLLDGRVSFEGTWFQMKRDGIVHSVRQGPFFIPTNAGEHEYKGVELGFRVAPASQLSLYAQRGPVPQPLRRLRDRAGGRRHGPHRQPPADLARPDHQRRGGHHAGLRGQHPLRRQACGRGHGRSGQHVHPRPVHAAGRGRLVVPGPHAHHAVGPQPAEPGVLLERRYLAGGVRGPGCPPAGAADDVVLVSLKLQSDGAAPRTPGVRRRMDVSGSTDMASRPMRDRIIDALRDLEPNCSVEDAIERLVFLAKMEEGLGSARPRRGHSARRGQTAARIVIELVWSPRAVRDLQAIRAFISQDSPVYAQLTLQRIAARVERLRRFPDSGRIVPERQSFGLREVVVGHYRVVYRRATDAVQIVTVFHGSRNAEREL